MGFRQVGNLSVRRCHAQGRNCRWYGACSDSLDGSDADGFLEICRTVVTHWSTNSASFRGPEIGEKTGLRIIVYGDSNILIFARFSDVENTFPRDLQSLTPTESTSGRRQSYWFEPRPQEET